MASRRRSHDALDTNGQERSRKTRTVARGDIDMQLAAMALHDMLDDRQPPAGSPGLARAAAVEPPLQREQVIGQGPHALRLVRYRRQATPRSGRFSGVQISCDQWATKSSRMV